MFCFLIFILTDCQRHQRCSPLGCNCPRISPCCSAGACWCSHRSREFQSTGNLSAKQISPLAQTIQPVSPKYYGLTISPHCKNFPRFYNCICSFRNENIYKYVHVSSSYIYIFIMLQKLSVDRRRQIEIPHSTLNFLWQRRPTTGTPYSEKQLSPWWWQTWGNKLDSWSCSMHFQWKGFEEI